LVYTGRLNLQITYILLQTLNPIYRVPAFLAGFHYLG